MWPFSKKGWVTELENGAESLKKKFTDYEEKQQWNDFGSDSERDKARESIQKITENWSLPILNILIDFALIMVDVVSKIEVAAGAVGKKVVDQRAGYSNVKSFSQPQTSTEPTKSMENKTDTKQRVQESPDPVTTGTLEELKKMPDSRNLDISNHSEDSKGKWSKELSMVESATEGSTINHQSTEEVLEKNEESDRPEIKISNSSFEPPAAKLHENSANPEPIYRAEEVDFIPFKPSLATAENLVTEDISEEECGNLTEDVQRQEQSVDQHEENESTSSDMRMVCVVPSSSTHSQLNLIDTPVTENCHDTMGNDELIAFLTNNSSRKSIRKTARKLINYGEKQENIEKNRIAQFLDGVQQDLAIMSLTELTEVFHTLIVLKTITANFKHNSELKVTQETNEVDILISWITEFKIDLDAYCQEKLGNVLKSENAKTNVAKEQKLRENILEKLKSVNAELLVLFSDVCYIADKFKRIRKVPKVIVIPKPMVPVVSPNAKIAYDWQEWIMSRQLFGISSVSSAQLQDPHQPQPGPCWEIVPTGDSNVMKASTSNNFGIVLYQSDLCQLSFSEMLNKFREDQNKNELIRLAEKKVIDYNRNLKVQQKFNKQEATHQKNKVRLYEEKRKLETETCRMILENLQKMRQCAEMFSACVALDVNFKAQEKKLADWLQVLRDLTSLLKNQFRQFEDVVKNLEEREDGYQEILTNEILSLHKSAITTYDIVFDACGTVKSLHEKFPDKIFLVILHKKLTKMSDKLFKTLEDIDFCMAHATSIVIIRQDFADIKASGIPTTELLREESTKEYSAEYWKLEEPRIYNSGAGPRIKEVPENNSQTEGSRK